MMYAMFSKRFFWPALAIAFSLFILWIIVLADLGMSIYLSQYIRHLPFGDKIGHFVLYGMLAFLINLALTNRSVKLLGQPVLLGSILVLTFAFVEEFTQIAISTRNFEVWDMICDTAGVILFSRLALLVGNWLWSEEK